MSRPTTKVLSTAIALAMGLVFPLPNTVNEALAFGRGGGGFHGGGFHGFGGGHFGGMHFGGAHFGGRHFGGAHFSGRHFGGAHFAGRHFGGARFAGQHFGGRHLGGNLGANRFGHANLAGREFGAGRLAHFNGIHGFNAGGFNRNAFGNMGAWDAWAGNNWGAGWNNWGSGFGYWAGPVFWPFFYGDMLSFALWPYGAYDPFFGYGPDYLLASIFWPGPLYGPYYDYGFYSPGYVGLYNMYGYAPYAADSDYYAYYGGSRHHRHHRHYAATEEPQTNNETDAEMAQTCAGLAPGITDLPFDRIEHAIKPTYAQSGMLNDLKGASAQANSVLRSSCPQDVPLTPLARLDAVATRLHAMSLAMQIIRGPLTTFYNSLDEQQKDKFATLGKIGEARRGEQPQNTNVGAICKQQTANFTMLPVQRIEQAVKPTEQQKDAFDALKSASSKAASDLAASCPTATPTTLTDRLDAIGKRLDALTEAVNTVKPALKDFYNSLSDDQKARFNVLGAPPQENEKTNG